MNIPQEETKESSDFRDQNPASDILFRLMDSSYKILSEVLSVELEKILQGKKTKHEKD